MEAGSDPAHISLVELADDTWSFPQPIPASTQDGKVTVAHLWQPNRPQVVKGP
jgi:hypothetical protein